MMLKLLLIFLCAAAVPVFAGIVGETAEGILYRQPDGVEVLLPKKPKRVVIGFSALAEPWHAAGGSAVALTGSRANESVPAAWRSLPQIGRGINLSTEKIVAERPDLVLLIYKVERLRAVGTQLRALGVTAVNLDYINFAGYREITELFARLNGHSQVNPAVREVEQICARTQLSSNIPSFAVLFAGTTGFMLESNLTHTGLAASMLGGINVVRERSRARIRFGLEPLLAANPTVIFIVTMGDEAGLKQKFQREIADKPAWKTLHAVKNGRVWFLPSELFLYLPGDRYPEAFRYLAERLYPQMFTSGEAR